MSVIYILITVSLAMAILFFVLFIRSVRSGQYDDSYTPSVRMLFEDETKIHTQKSTNSKSKLNS